MGKKMKTEITLTYKKSIFLALIAILAVPYFVSAQEYPDGTLIRADGDPKVFVIHNNQPLTASTRSICSSSARDAFESKPGSKFPKNFQEGDFLIG